MVNRFLVVEGNTETVLSILEGDAADAAIAKYMDLYTPEQTEDKLDRCIIDTLTNDTGGQNLIVFC